MTRTADTPTSTQIRPVTPAASLIISKLQLLSVDKKVVFKIVHILLASTSMASQAMKL